MKTQISRHSHDGTKRYTGVYQQQGRMITDADWNELVDVVKEQLRRALGELVGSGVPRLAPLKVEESGGIKLRPGSVYVGGVRAELPGTALRELTDQPDFPHAPALLAGGARLYADVWERTVVSLEDASLRDPGLHGADTCSRTQTLVQIKCCPHGTDPQLPASNPPCGTAAIQLERLAGSSAAERADPCLTETAESARMGNYLFRVEVHEARHTVAGTGETLTLTLKWSSENGAEQQSLVWRDADGLEHQNFAALPDEFTATEWTFEVYNDACEKHLGMHLRSDFTPSRGILPAAHGEHDPLPNIQGEPARYIRRWDGFCTLDLTRPDDHTAWTPVASTVKGADRGQPVATDSPGHGHVDLGTSSLSISLESLVLTVPLGQNVFLPGDYWLAVVREGAFVAGTIDERVKVLNGGKPLGIIHHYLELGTVNAAGHLESYPAGGQRERLLDFPPLTDLTAERVGYNPSPQAARWADINEEAVGAGPITVQEAIDDLVANLESTDVSYLLPLCQTTSYGADTLYQHLKDEIANQVTGGDGRKRTKLQDLWDALLCKLDASRVPYDPTANSGRWADVGETVWVKQFGGVGEDHNRGLAVAPNGDIILAGSFEGTAAFGDHILTSGGATDLYLARLDPNGKVRWARRFGATAGQQGEAVALTPNGDIVMVASFAGKLNLGGASVELTSTGAEDVIVARFDPLGNCRWARKFGGPTTDIGYSLAVDANGDVVVTGFFSGTITLMGDHTSAGLYDIFVVKFAGANGVIQWSKRFGSTGYDVAYAVATDASRNVFLTGKFSGTVAFGTDTLVSAGNSDTFLAKLDPAGNPLWARRFGGSFVDEGRALAVDTAGNVLLTGHFQGTINLGGAALTSAGEYDFFVAKLSGANGNHLWSQRHGGPKSDYGSAITVRPNGEVVLAGYFSGTTDFGSPPFNASGDYDAFVVVLDGQAGQLRRSARLGGRGATLARSLGLDPDGAIVLAGSFVGTTDFSGEPLTSDGAADIFVTKLRFDARGPLTVQAAIDELVRQLDSADIEYAVPSCATKHDSLRRRLPSLRDLDDGSSTRVASVLNALLCELDAGAIPYAASETGSPARSIGDLMVKKTGDSMTGALTIDTGTASATALNVKGVLETLGFKLQAAATTPDKAVLTYERATGLAKWLETSLTAWVLSAGNLSTDAGSVTGKLTLGAPGGVAIPSGNVGVGTAATPLAKLQVVGGAIMPSAGNAADRGIMFPSDPGGGAADAAWIRYYPRIGENTTFEIGTSNDPQDHIALMPSGNVGVGTTDPQAKLHVVGGAIMPSIGNSADRGIMFPRNPGGGGADAAWIRYYARQGEETTFEIGTSNDASDHIALMPSGNVGIGTITPNAKLEVDGHIVSSGMLIGSRVLASTVRIATSVLQPATNQGVPSANATLFFFRDSEIRVEFTFSELSVPSGVTVSFEASIGGRIIKLGTFTGAFFGGNTFSAQRLTAEGDLVANTGMVVGINYVAGGTVILTDVRFRVVLI